MIDLEQRRLDKEKELVLMRLNDAKRKEEISTLEKERLEDAKRNLNYRYASIPHRSDLYPWPYFREFYGGSHHPYSPAVHHSYNGGCGGACGTHGCAGGCGWGNGWGPNGHGCFNNTHHGSHFFYDHAGCGCGNHGPHTMTPMRCKSCFKEKTTYVLPPIDKKGHFQIERKGCC